MVLGLILKFLNILLMNRTTFNVFHYYHSFIVNRKVVLLQTDKQNEKDEVNYEIWFRVLYQKISCLLLPDNGRLYELWCLRQVSIPRIWFEIRTSSSPLQPSRCRSGLRQSLFRDILFRSILGPSCLDERRANLRATLMWVWVYYLFDCYSLFVITPAPIDVVCLSRRHFIKWICCRVFYNEVF